MANATIFADNSTTTTPQWTTTPSSTTQGHLLATTDEMVPLPLTTAEFMTNASSAYESWLNSSGNGTTLATTSTPAGGLVPPFWDLPTTIILSVWLIVVIVFSVVGNTMVLMVLLRNKGMRSKTNMFIANLAVADISVAVLDMPFSLATVIYGDWPFGDIFCQFNALTNVFFIIASLQTLMMISIHKYFAIVQPLKRVVTKKRAWLMIAIIWFMALACAIGPLFGWTDNIYKDGAVECGPVYPETLLQKSHGIFIFSVGYLGPFFVMAYCYGRIFYTMNQHAQRLRIHSDWEEERIFRQQRRIAVTMFIVLVIFLVCWTPYFTYATWAILEGQQNIPAIMNAIAYWSGFTNSGCNPLVYSFRNKAFRKGFRRLFRVGQTGFKRGFTFLGSAGSTVDASPMARRRKISATGSVIVDSSPGTTPQTVLRRRGTETVMIKVSPNRNARKIIDPLTRPHTVKKHQISQVNGADGGAGDFQPHNQFVLPHNESDRSLQSTHSSTGNESGSSQDSGSKILPSPKGKGERPDWGSPSREPKGHRSPARSYMHDDWSQKPEWRDVMVEPKQLQMEEAVPDKVESLHSSSPPSSPLSPVDIALSLENTEETQL